MQCTMHAATQSCLLISLLHVITIALQSLCMDLTHRFLNYGSIDSRRLLLGLTTIEIYMYLQLDVYMYLTVVCAATVRLRLKIYYTYH